MKDAIETDRLTKRFGATSALDGVSVSVPEGAICGLIGRNGSGKTTLLRHVVGLLLPTSGLCRTLGRPSAELGPDELGRIGFVQQEGRFLGWMSVEQHLRYVASFYDVWDAGREERLVQELELDRRATVASLSPGNVQKLAVILAVCHHPRLLLLDEPVSAMDPIVRERLLSFLIEMLQQDELTVVISSHVLRDVERVVDWIVCLEGGRVAEAGPWDALQERYAEWLVTSANGSLPGAFGEPWVIEQAADGTRARLVVLDGDQRLEEFQRRHHVVVEPHRLNLERLFPHLIKRKG